jgi:hypothetical protein
MTMGIGIALLAIGAILSFAVRDSVPGIDLSMVGYILMGAGALGLLIGLVTARRGEVVERREDSL